MCASHHQEYKDHKFFIRFRPSVSFILYSFCITSINVNNGGKKQIKRYIFVYFDSYRKLTQSQHLQQYHGKAIAVNIDDTFAPLPILFVIHETMARGINFVQPTPDEEVTDSWQRWMVVGGVVNEKEDGTFTFNRDAPTSPPSGWPIDLQESSAAFAAPHSPVRDVITPLTDDIRKELLAYQRTTQSWKAWQSEITLGQE
jgi:hypothetical protein